MAFFIKRFFVRLLAIVIPLLAFGCTSARVGDAEADRLFRAQNYTAAADHLKKGYDEQGESGRDSLLYLLDYALALHTAGKYDEAIAAFAKADKLAEIKDYTSLASEAGAILTSDNVRDYKAEEFETVYISAYLAIDYAAKGDLEGALVEARRVNSKLERLRRDGGRTISQSAFARYFAAVIREAQDEPNDAYIDYKRTYELKPDYPDLAHDLWRTAFFSNLDDAMDQWSSHYGLSSELKSTIKKNEGPRATTGELIVIFENGISPQKGPNPAWASLPKFFPRYNPVRSASVVVDGQPLAETSVLDNIEAVAIQNLDEKLGGIIARRVAGRVVKEVVAEQVESKTKSPLLGFLTRVALVASDRADLRSWELLPKEFQMARVRLAPGLHTVRLLPGGVAPLADKTVQINAGQRVFLPFRYMP